MIKLICLVFGHKYRLLRNITSEIRELKCKRCGAEFGMCDATKSVLPLDAELRETHKEIIDANIAKLRALAKPNPSKEFD